MARSGGAGRARGDAANHRGGPLEALEAARRSRESAEESERDAIRAARSAGLSWTRIGAVYGMTKQGAQQRFKALIGDEDPQA